MAAATMALLAAPSAFASTGVTVKDATGLAAVGPTSAEHGFPTWYEDRLGTRLEPCLDGDNPLCGFLPGDIPDETKPISFPGNFPEEFFYTLTDSSLTLPGGGTATLTSGLEAAFLNGVAPGEQVTFTRIRIVVKGGPRNTTLLFKHPFGELTIDTDATGAGRFVRDVAPSIGNFSLALNGDVGPFLKATNAPAGYLGDPGVPGTVTGGPLRNTFEAYDKMSATPTVAIASTDQFSVQGKIGTNTGVVGDSAVVNGKFIDVYATSGASDLEVVGQPDKFPTTLMAHDSNSKRHFARVPLADGASVTDVTVRNNSDKPASTAVIKVQGISVTKAEFDGTNLTVNASAVAPATFPLTVEGIGEIPASGTATFPMIAPPGAVTVSSGGVKATAPVVIGSTVLASPAGTTAAPVGPPVGPVCDPAPCADGTVSPTATPLAKVAVTAVTVPRGIATVIDGSTSTNATTFSTVVKDGSPAATIDNPTTNKPTVTLPTWAATTDTAPKPALDNRPVVVTFTASNGTETSSVDVTITPAAENLAVTTARFRAGTEFRVAGTSTITGSPLIISPPTQVVVYAKTATGNWVKIGTSPVDTTGAWNVRPAQVPTTAYSQYLVQSSRGATATGNLAR